MTLLVLGLALFLGIHSVSIFAIGWRDEQVAHRGEGPWKGLYSAVSAVGLVMIVFGFAQARHSPVVLYVPPLWMRHVALLLMAPVFALLIAAYFPGRIQSAAKHPMLLATKLWALSHLLANGNLADLLLFGGFLAWAVADRISLKRRPARPIPGAVARPLNDVLVLLGGILLYVVFALFLHRWLIGVSPLG
jgi:uncharacterized membrane protein